MTGRQAPCAVVVAAAAAALAWLATAQAAGPGQLRVRTDLQPASALFGDPVTATVEVDAGGGVDASSIRVVPSFGPFAVRAKPVVRRSGGRVLFSYGLLCVTDGCLPTRSSRLLRLPPAEVTARSGRRVLHASAAWPALTIASRLGASDLSGPVRFRSPSAPPPPAYRFAPGRLVAGLIAAAALCVVAAFALAGRGLVRLRRGARVRQRSPLQVAIAYVRESTGRSAPDRRRALSLLAEAADEQEPALAAGAGQAAWSRPSPTPLAATELADRASALPDDDR